MSKIIKFPDGDDDDNSGNITVNKEYCSTCGGGLELWTSTDFVAYGVCPVVIWDLVHSPLYLLRVLSIKWQNAKKHSSTGSRESRPSYYSVM